MRICDVSWKLVLMVNRTQLIEGKICHNIGRENEKMGRSNYTISCFAKYHYLY